MEFEYQKCHFLPVFIFHPHWANFIAKFSYMYIGMNNYGAGSDKLVNIKINQLDFLQQQSQQQQNSDHSDTSYKEITAQILISTAYIILVIKII